MEKVVIPEVLKIEHV